MLAPGQSEETASLLQRISIFELTPEQSLYVFLDLWRPMHICWHLSIPWTQKSTIAGDLVGSDPRNFDLRAGLRASAQKTAAARKLRQQQVEQLALAVEQAEPCATLDHDTPGDGHCLFHALAAGGLLDDIPESLTVQELRDLAVSGATMEQLVAAAAGTGASGLPVQEYIDGMRIGLYGDNLVIGLLAQNFGRDICVIRHDYTRTYLGAGGEIDTVIDGGCNKLASSTRELGSHGVQPIHTTVPTFGHTLCTIYAYTYVHIYTYFVLYIYV